MATQDISFDVEDRRFQQALRDFANATGRPISQVIKKNARLVAVSLAFQTQPFGNGPAAKLMGEKAVSRDIARVYASVHDAFAVLQAKDEEMAKGFYKAMLQGRWQKAQNILKTSGTAWRNVTIGPFDSERHKRFRDRRGRVNRYIPSQIVTNPKKVNTHRTKKLRMVGFAKGGWAAAAKSLTGNTTGIPQFVTRHKSKAPGHAVDNSNRANDPHVRLVNSVSYINTVCPPEQQARALQHQRHKMLQELAHVTNAAAHSTMGAIATIT